jgi:hypothetical protein
MVDPSLLLDRNVLDVTLGRIQVLRDEGGLEFFVAGSLQPNYLDPNEYRALPGFFETGADVANADESEIVGRLEEVLSELTDLGVTIWERPASARDEFAAFHGALGEHVNSVMLQDILFEEWFFLTHESWLVSRIKAPFHAIVRAGEVGVELLNPIVRKTLKKDASHVVRSADRVRTLGKWIAMGGPAAVALLNPIVGALAVSPVAGGFLLLDPPENG